MIKTEIDGKVALITLAREEKHNALNLPMIEAINSFLHSLKGNKNIRALIIKANGKNFCAGADIEWLLDGSALNKIDNINDAKKLSDMFANIASLPFITISYINGAAIGGGFGLAATTDIKIAATDASFSTPETKIGMVPAIIAKYIVETIGISEARYMFLTGKKITAQEALQKNIVNEVIPKSDFEQHKEALLKSILKTCPIAVKLTKSMLSSWPLETKSDYEIMAEARQSVTTRDRLAQTLKRNGD